MKDLKWFKDQRVITLEQKNTDTIIQQTKTKAEKTIEFKLKKINGNFSKNLPTNLSEVGKWLLALTSLKQSFLFLIYLKKTILFRFQHEVIRFQRCWRIY